MAYCMNCGEKLENEECVCEACGTNMSKALKAQGISVGQSSHMGILGTIIEKIKKVIIGMILAPVSSTIDYSKELGLKGGIILTAVMASIFAVIETWAYDDVFSNLISIIGKVVKASNGNRTAQNSGLITNQAIETVKRMKMPYLNVFMANFLIFISSTIIIFLVSYLASRYIFKQKGKILELWNSTICAAIPFITGLFAAILLKYVSIALCLIPLVTGFTITMICLHNGIKVSMNITDNKAAVLLPFSYIGIVIIVYISIERLLANYVTILNVKRFIISIVYYFVNTGGMLY